MIEAFLDRWRDKREHQHALAAINNIGKSQNKTMVEFNKRFNDLVTSLHKNIKPLKSSILIYYIDNFEGDLIHQLSDKDPSNLSLSQSMAIKIDRNMKALQR